MNIYSSVYTSVSKATSHRTIFHATFSEWKCIYPFPCQRDRKDAEISFKTPERKAKTIKNKEPPRIKAAYLIEISTPPHLWSHADTALASTLQKRWAPKSWLERTVHQRDHPPNSSSLL